MEDNKMYKYLLNHNYISLVKKSNHQQELTIERAECIANKFNSLNIELQQELSIANYKLKKIEEYIYGHKLFGMRYGKTLYRESLINILSIIKGGKE